MSTKTTYEYTISTECGICHYDAESMDDAVRQYSTDSYPGGVWQADSADELLAEVREPENRDRGCWLWIESNEAPDGERRTANQENIP